MTKKHLLKYFYDLMIINKKPNRYLYIQMEKKQKQNVTINLKLRLLITHRISESIKTK